MQLTDICVSLELAKQLRKAGYPQDSIFFRGVTIYGDHDQPVMEDVKNLHSKLFPNDGMIYYAAPTAAEIGEELIKNGISFTSGSTIGFDNPEDKFNCYTNHRFNEYTCITKIEHSEHGETEVNARAKMWLYLKEHNLLPKVKE